MNGWVINDRLCPVCADGIEDEKHVLLCCHLCNDTRHGLFEKAVNVCTRIVLIIILGNYSIISDDNNVRFTVKSCSEIFKIRRDTLYH